MYSHNFDILFYLYQVFIYYTLLIYLGDEDKKERLVIDFFSEATENEKNGTGACNPDKNPFLKIKNTGLGMMAEIEGVKAESDNFKKLITIAVYLDEIAAIKPLSRTLFRRYKQVFDGTSRSINILSYVTANLNLCVIVSKLLCWKIKLLN